MQLKQFSLRDALLLIAFVAVALGWWVDRRNRVAAPARYQMQTVDGHAFVLDTGTGQVWERWLPPGNGSNSPGFNEPKTP
jgi:hypothetical protein